MQVNVMLLRYICVLALGLTALTPGPARAGCADEISKLMSQDTERMLSLYIQVTRRIEREGPTPSLRAEECRIARQLEPQLAGQIAALKQSNCRRDPRVATALAEIVRGHEDDLADLRKVTALAECR
jgi:hypothetical protein